LDGLGNLKVRIPPLNFHLAFREKSQWLEDAETVTGQLKTGHLRALQNRPL
jgi:hypothetical protein